MNFNQLKKATRGSLFACASALLIMSCNDDKSANNSTSGAGETDTTTSVTTPVVKTKKSGKAKASVTADDTKIKMTQDKQGYYNRTEVSPAFDGGDPAIENFVTNNIEYPQDAIDNNVEGTVTVQFGVDENGNVSNVSTVGNKIGYGLEEEAIRVVNKMPKWKPGQVKGKNVKVWRTLPINYRLEES
ncbi:MAG: energy transducer TonB [Sphingobacteriales bacterium]|nr:MAG: energy transducer TonB [Sphingobacteriales bacterium]